MDYITGAVKGVYNNTTSVVKSFAGFWPRKQIEEKVIIKTERCVHTSLRSLMGPEKHWIAVAGVCGALGVALGAYGEHGLGPDFPPQRKKVFDTANKYHMLHSLALMAVPLARRPILSGTMFASGMFIFCGTCYVHALTGNESIIRLTPYGGMILLFAWLSLLV